MCKKYFKQTRIRSDPPAVLVAPHVDACVSAERLRHDAFARQFGDLTAAEAKSLLAQRSALAELRRMRVGRTLASSDDMSIALSCTVQAAMAYAPTAEGVLANAAILCKVLAGNSDAALRLAPLANRLKACELNGPAKFSLVYELAQANVEAEHAAAALIARGVPGVPINHVMADAWARAADFGFHNPKLKHEAEDKYTASHFPRTGSDPALHTNQLPRSGRWGCTRTTGNRG